MQPHNTTHDTRLKCCIECSEDKPATTEYFGRVKANRDGLCNACKVCKAAYMRAWNQANKERKADRGWKYYAGRKEYVAAWGRAYRAANKERIRQQRAGNREERKEKLSRWREANREHIVAYRRAYAAANIEAQRARTRNRYARKAKAEGRHTAEDVKRQYKAQKGKCYYCGVKVGKTYHADHIVPLARGGSDWPENIVVACPTCNTSKRDKLPHEWARGGRLL